jgi:multimeric flavodoxin WrbA
MTDINTLVLVCTLRPSPAASSSELLGRQVLEEFDRLGATGELVRVVDHDIHFGVSTDEGDGDEWPAIREKVLAADILVIATPIWMGQPASVCKMVLERLDAEIGETDDNGRPLVYGKVAAVAVVGNEDGAHHTVAECLQGLNDVGFAVAPNGCTYWVGEAMQGTDYKDLDAGPEKTTGTTRTLALNSHHLSTLLKSSQFPPS